MFMENVQTQAVRNVPKKYLEHFGFDWPPILRMFLRFNLIHFLFYRGPRWGKHIQDSCVGYLGGEPFITEATSKRLSHLLVGLTQSPQSRNLPGLTIFINPSMQPSQLGCQGWQLTQDLWKDTSVAGAVLLPGHTGRSQLGSGENPNIPSLSFCPPHISSIWEELKIILS